LSENKAKLPIHTRVFYGLGAPAYIIKESGFSLFLMIYYNQVLGVSAALVGLALLIATIIDAISDPLVGHFSDNFHSKWGRRHPFMYAAILPVTLAYFFLWNPPAWVTGDMLFGYLLALAIAVRMMITFFEIPNTSLAPELTHSYDDRTTLLSIRSFFGWTIGFSMTMFTFAYLLKATPEYPVGVLNVDGWRAYGLLSAAFIFGAMTISSIGTHSRIPSLSTPPARKPFNAGETFRELIATLGNRPFLILFAAALFGAMASGINSSMITYVNTFFWEFDSTQIAFLVSSALIATPFAVVLAPYAGRKFGKKHAAIGIGFCAFTIAPLPITLRLLGLFPENGDPILHPIMFLYTMTDYILIIATIVLSVSMISDVVEDSQLKTGRRSEGLLFAARGFASKCITGVGIMTAGIMLTVIGFPEGAKPGEVAPEVIYNLGLMIAPTLFVLYMISLLIISQFPIDRKTHEANLAALNKGGGSTGAPGGAGIVVASSANPSALSAAPEPTQRQNTD
jgi:Na+/melibiose symporter-like transporter